MQQPWSDAVWKANPRGYRVYMRACQVTNALMSLLLKLIERICGMKY